MHAPAQADLDRVFSGAVGARIYSGPERPDRPAPRVLAELSAGRELDELARGLAIGRTGFRCMCVGNERIELLGPEGTRAKLALHHGASLRWDGEWQSDAELAAADRLCFWLATRGVPGPLVARQSLQRQRSAWIRALEAWDEAMPECLRGMKEALGDGHASPDALEQALAALRTSYPNTQARVLALLDWLAAAAGPWSGYPAHEHAAIELLEQAGAGAVVGALEKSDASAPQLRAAARFFAMVSPKGAPLRVPRHLVERMRVALRAAGHGEHLHAFARRFASP